MSVTIHIIGAPSLILDTSKFLTAEDACLEICQNLKIIPAASHLFGLRYLKNELFLFLSPSDLFSESGCTSYDFRMRYLPSLTNLSYVDSSALNYIYYQVRNDFIDGKMLALNATRLQGEALGLGVTAMYCQMQDSGCSLKDVLKNYKHFLPKIVLKNSGLLMTTDCLKKNLKSVAANPPGDVWLCKKLFVEEVVKKNGEHFSESYPVKAEHATDESSFIEYFLIVQPVATKDLLAGLHLQSRKKTFANQYICSIEEVCYISVNYDNRRMEIARINGIPHYFFLESQEMMKSCVSAVNGYYRLTEKWTFDLCRQLLTPLLVKLKSIKCHGPVGEPFAYEKLKKKRENKQGCYLLRQSCISYNEYCLDVCLEESQPPKTFSIEKSSSNYWTFKDFSTQKCQSIQELLINHHQFSTEIPISGLKECIPPSENDVSDLLLCRHDRMVSKDSNDPHTSLQVPVCIHPKDILLYVGLGMTETQFSGRFTSVHRGVWNRKNQDQLPIVRKTLKPEFCVSHSQEFLESVQKSIFWRCESIVHHYGIILNSSLSLIMECLPLGPLDQYLQTTNVQLIDLIEAATNLANAVFYLEENNYVHANIRCRNLLVASHTAKSFRIKLTDPGIPSFSAEDLPWLPIEFYGCLGQVQRKSTADIWACGTTVWEIFSHGKKPCDGFIGEKTSQAFLRGWRPPIPDNCPDEMYRIMLTTWSPDAHQRPKAQTLMRDINQTLSSVYNSARSNVYEEMKPQSSWSGSWVSGLTDATTLQAVSEDLDIISTDSLLGEKYSMDDDSSFSVLLSRLSIKDSLVDGENESEDSAGQIYELDQHNLELGQLIGQGFYGEVRMGVLKHRDGTQETVAVKKLKNTARNTPEMQDLQRECTIMKSLSHPNIMSVKAIMMESSMMLVMEYIPMGSLLAYVRSAQNNQRITDQQMLHFASDIAVGMEYLGEKGIVHRDLAARNILVASEDLVKISDFGLARYVGYDGYYVIRQNAQKLPLPWYAPESLSYWKFSMQSDVWSYGVMLYEMFSRGEQPILVSGDHTLLLQALEQGRRLPCPPRCPRIVYTDLMRPCWHQQPHRRPSFKNIQETIACSRTQL